MGQLDDKVAVITGATGDIGTATAKAFAREGASVVLVGRNKARLEEIAAELVGVNGDAEGVVIAVADVSRPDDVAGYVRVAVERFGRIDVFVNNAGYQGVVAPTGSYPIDEFDQVMATNVRGTWLGMRAVMPVMAEQPNGGTIIITSSMGGTKGFPGFSAYVTSKHANIGLMRTCAVEGAPIGIRVNCVNPGPVESSMMSRIHELAAPDAPQAVKDQFLAHVPMGRYAAPEEVANVMTFLADDASSFVTGGVYTVDGGVMA
ncbi:SDR family oxidoreductase [Streptomyces sp. NPDC005373]|uniref:SDR family NAD(P)-dependent oxidoreductase n=1 Tax=Streptomyces sp. NPDC005373 TaxID=3156879 RepID=UPI0033AB19DE